MVKRLDFRKRLNLQKLHYYPGIWAVESELTEGLCYGIADGKFAVLRATGALVCPLAEVAKLAGMLKPEVKDEVIGIYEMWKETR